MSTANPSPVSEGDNEQEGTAREQREQLHADRDAEHERIDDVRELDVGDRVLFGERSKELVVEDTDARQIRTMSGSREQHAVEVSGEWSNARTFLLINKIHLFRGHRTGEISVDAHKTRPVWRVSK